MSILTLRSLSSWPRRLGALVSGVAVGLCLVPAVAFADGPGGPWHGGGGDFRPPPHEHERGPWHEREREREWRGGPGGNWWHGRHDGRDGWWWIVGGGWYWYPAPVYPYPPAPVYTYPAPPPSAVNPDSVWYYCRNPAGYYPSVPACAVPWQTVPAGQPQPVPMGPPLGMIQPSSPGIDKTTGGTVLGAIGGGLVGSQFGRGPGTLAAVAAGTLLGAFIGHEVGESLDHADAVAESRAERSALQLPIGRSITWSNAQTGHSGTIMPIRDGSDQAGNYCREFQQQIVVDGQVDHAFGTACRQPDGSWAVVDR